MTDPDALALAAHEAAHALDNGWREMTADEIDDEFRDAAAEDRARTRAGYWDPPARFDDLGPTGHGWAPDPFPGGGLI